VPSEQHPGGGDPLDSSPFGWFSTLLDTTAVGRGRHKPVKAAVRKAIGKEAGRRVRFRLGQRL